VQCRRKTTLIPANPRSFLLNTQRVASSGKNGDTP
jgi:hypothetical protein